jgi:hypothetical protein
VIVRDPGTATAPTVPGRRNRGGTTTTPPVEQPPTGDTSVYSAATYSADYPAGWSILEDDASKGKYTETKIESPDGGAAVVIDRTPGNAQDPQTEAEGVERSTARTPGYSRVAFAPIDLGGRPGFEWVFDLPAGRRVDFFTNTGGGRFAVLGEGTDFTTALATARAVAESLR